MNNHIRGLIEETEKLNAIKSKAITELEGRLDTCPQQWLQATKRFIKTTKDNIAARHNLINELKGITLIADPLRMINITYELEVLDNEDCKAVDMYNSLMDEYIE